MESIEFAKLPDGIIVIRVSGKGNHQNSASLRHVMELTSSPESCPRYIFDLEKCTTMDSTFMGVMATIGLRQHRAARTRGIIVNPTANVAKQLDLLGLKYILDIRGGKGDEDAPSPPSPRRGFSAVDTPEMTRLDRIIMMIEAHEQLADIDKDNAVKFRGVLDDLRKSLDRASKE